MRRRICPDLGDLMAYRDRELSEDAMGRVREHLTSCERCQGRLAELASQGTRVGSTLQMLESAPEARKLSLSAEKVMALAVPSHRKENTIVEQKRIRTRSIWQPVGIAAAVCIAMVAVYSFAPTRALARDLLGIFRVRKFAVVRLDSAQVDQFEAVAGQVQSTLMPEAPEILADEPEIEVADLEAARQAAGFSVAAPSYVFGEAVEGYAVKGRMALGATVEREALVALLEMADMDGDEIPVAFAGGSVTASFESCVRMVAPSWELIQVWKPYAEYPTGLDPALVGEAGFRLIGIPEREAQRIAERIDWATTLIVPIPSDIMRVTEIEIAGSQGLLISSKQAGEGLGTQKMLIWQSGDVLYGLTASGMGDERMVKIAGSLSW